MDPLDAIDLQKAIEFAAEKHRTQRTLEGLPYITHPLRVMELVRPYGSLHMISAVLHDVVEDTDVTVRDIEHMFGWPVSVVVGRLTRPESVPYETYIQGLRGDEVALLVKLADLTDNSRLDRMVIDGQKSYNRIAKHATAYKEVKKMLADLGVKGPVLR